MSEGFRVYLKCTCGTLNDIYYKDVLPQAGDELLRIMYLGDNGINSKDALKIVCINCNKNMSIGYEVTNNDGN